MSAFYTPIHGDQIQGSPATLNRYITAILAAGAHFQFISGDTLEVLVPGAGQAVVTSLGDTVVAAKPAADVSEVVKESTATTVAEAVEAIEEGSGSTADITEAVNDAVEQAVDTTIDVANDEDPKPAPARRGRKPKAETAPAEEGE